MILLRANRELQQTFEKLIQTAKLPVQWNGIFAVVDNYMILQGEVRSLFFNFDNKKVATNIIEIPEMENIVEVGNNVRLQNAINMILYAFGKWGTISGIRVEKDYAQLGQLFTGIMEEYDAEPEFTPSHMRFYRNGMRATYEDVIQMAIEYDEEEPEEDEASGQGLWRKIIWKKARGNFACVNTTIEERRGERLGNNFYMVGYLCPICKKNLHMVVYPVGKEFRIETEEGDVLLARAATCEQCQCFYTPRPKKLFAEGDIYIMEFGGDTVAYEDYMELLGRDGDRVSNYHCNEFVDGRSLGEDESEESLEELYVHLPELSEEELRKIEARMEEGFYSDESIRRFEQVVKAQSAKRRGMNMEEEEDEQADISDASVEGTDTTADGKKNNEEHTRTANVADRNDRRTGESTQSKSYEREDNHKEHARIDAGHIVYQGHGKDTYDREQQEKGSVNREKNEVIITPEERDEVRKKYDARMNMLDRYSERQLRELKGQLERERKLYSNEKADYIKCVEQKLYTEQMTNLNQKAESCQGKSYIVIKRMIEEVEAASVPREMKLPLLDKLEVFKREQATREVGQLVAKMPKNLDRNQYKQYVQRIKDYEGVDFTPYEANLRERREAAEKQEIANVVKRARKVSREDMVELRDRLQEGDFLPELVLPYIEKVENRIKEMDEEAIALICPNPMVMTFEEGIRAYEQIEQGDFLPELKKDALKVLKKRLAKIKTDECELLVEKLKQELTEAGIGNEPKHYYYPARKALLGQASTEEIGVIEYAISSYAAGRGPFEYPIFVVDASRNGTGKEGIILTPDHLYYSTMLNAYGVEIGMISRIEASTGILNRGLYLYQKNGTKTKLPYVVEHKDLEAYAKVLDSYIRYLQEKPDSRSLMYLAREQHETICCFRCGYEYKGGDVCPKCGYQNNN